MWERKKERECVRETDTERGRRGKKREKGDNELGGSEREEREWIDLEKNVNELLWLFLYKTLSIEILFGIIS